MGAFRDIPDRKRLFDQISTMKPEGWLPGSIDAIATSSSDGRRLIIKAVNYRGERNVLLVRLQGSGVPDNAVARLHTVSAGLMDSASLERPNAIAPVTQPLKYATEFSVDLEPYTVAVVEIRAE
jgi:alpha-L-arabinofuranosidase